jgi:hypothetical protein
MLKFTLCSVILSDSSVGEILVAPQTELHAQRTALPLHNSEKHRFMQAYLMLDMCELGILNPESVKHYLIRFRFILDSNISVHFPLDGFLDFCPSEGCVL